MLRIREVIVTFLTEKHIWTKHHVTPEETEEVCFSNPLTIRGRDKSLAVYGQSEAGRYLTVFLYPKGGGVYSLATARDMNEAERSRYQRLHRK